MNVDARKSRPKPAGASPAARGDCAHGAYLGRKKAGVADIRDLEGRFGGSDPQVRP